MVCSTPGVTPMGFCTLESAATGDGMVFPCTLGDGGNTGITGFGEVMIAAGGDLGGIRDGDRSAGGGIGKVVGNGIGYIVFKMLAICRTPCIVGSPILIPGGGAVE